MRIATWNTQWTTHGQLRRAAVQSRMSSLRADVVVLTETALHLVRDSWANVAHADTHVYSGSPADGAKVLIATNWPLQRIEVREPVGLPPGNVVAADVLVGAVAIRVIGLVIRYNAKACFVDRLPDLLAPLMTDCTVVAGDFNLRIPGGPLTTRLLDCLSAAGLTILTAGTHAPLANERSLVDHIAATPSLEHVSTTVWSRFDPSYRNGAVELTDHAAAAVDLHPDV